ncbi:hypothetical protein BDF22DRAFT_740531 [Syncephalis plumigaleata]|nr:hypothetical protein BDF22DRAFT_740531 [Syncephalis plumigaleata]
MALSRNPGSSSSRSPITRKITRLMPLENHWFLGRSEKGSFYVRLALLSSIVQAIVIITLETLVYRAFKSELKIMEEYYGQYSDKLSKDFNLNKNQLISAYHLIFLAAQVFQLIVCVDGVFRQDTIQIIGLSIFNFLSLIYSVVQLVQTSNAITAGDADIIMKTYSNFERHSSKGMEIAIIVILAFLSITFAFQAWHLFQEFGWKIYKKIGADLNIRRMYRLYQIFVTLLKFAIFIFLAFAAQVWFILSNANEIDGMIAHTVISLGGSMVIFLVGFWSIRAESQYGIYAFMASALGTMSYLIYYICKINAPHIIKETRCTGGYIDSCDKYAGARIFLTLFATTSMLMAIIMLVISYFVWKNFGKGLKLRLRRKPTQRDYELGHGAGTYNDIHQRGQRWSIE